MLVDTDLAPSQVKRLAANIYRASRRIQELLQDLVNVSRGKTSGAEVCRLAEVVAAAVEASSGQAESQNVSLHYSVPEEIELPLERNRIERVLLNLIGNAVEAMPGGGEIRIEAAAGEDGVRIQVEDDGPGIPAEVRQRLFEPFVTAGKKNGLGLGLALARQTVLDHGGDMWVEAKSKGARFVIRLPVRKPAPAPAASLN
jgi:signal transduction histidine kinase